MRTSRVARVTVLAVAAATAVGACSTSTSPTPASTGAATVAPTGAATVAPTGWLVFDSSPVGSDFGDLYLMEIGSEPVALTSTEDQAEFAGPCDPTGTRVAYTVGAGETPLDVWVVGIDGSRPGNMTRTDDMDEYLPTWSPNSPPLAFTAEEAGGSGTPNADIYVLDVPGETARLTDDPASDSEPAWSPDGTKIAFVSDRDRTLGTDLYLMNADGSRVTRLTDDEAFDHSPTWSPDGSQIAFRSNEGNLPADIFVVSADGSDRTNLTSSEAEEWFPAWSPDGRFIAFQTSRDGNWEIYAMAADGSGAVNLTNDPAENQRPSWCLPPVLTATYEELQPTTRDQPLERSVNVAAGELFRINLAEDAYAGWEDPVVESTAGLVLVGSAYSTAWWLDDPAPDNVMTGAGPLRSFTFRSASAGSATIEFIQGPLPGEEEAGSWRVVVTVDAS